MDTLTRRSVLGGLLGGSGLVLTARAGLAASEAAGTPPGTPASDQTTASTATTALPAASRPAEAPVHASFPSTPPELAREMVGASHARVARVKELLAAHPAAARATYDWGFGDWESALGAASHVGNREIAELLLAHGARPDIFSAAMLGQLAVVQAFVAASPGIERTRGPHGITLLAHARAGGEAAASVLAYLTELGTADPTLERVALSESDLAAIPGEYVFGTDPGDVFKVTVKDQTLSLRRGEGNALRLSHRGGRGFSPAGAEVVRIQFSAETPPLEVAIFDPGLVVTGRRRP